MNLSLLTLTSYSWFQHGTTHTLVQWFGIKLQFIHFKDSVTISELHFTASRIHSVVSGGSKDHVTNIFTFYRNFRSAEIIIFLFLYSSVIYLFGNLYYSPAEFKTPATGTFVPEVYIDNPTFPILFVQSCMWTDFPQISISRRAWHLPTSTSPTHSVLSCLESEPGRASNSNSGK